MQVPGAPHGGGGRGPVRAAGGLDASHPPGGGAQGQGQAAQPSGRRPLRRARQAGPARGGEGPPQVRPHRYSRDAISLFGLLVTRLYQVLHIQIQGDHALREDFELNLQGMHPCKGGGRSFGPSTICTPTFLLEVITT